tara:strand:- start:470 stop:838 length:369 start_codon:yes stop_codon:yes gene_type:complete
MKDGYQSIALETEVLDASPHRLVQMMYEKCINNIGVIKHHMNENNIEKKCHSINQVLDIIGYLKQILNKDNEESRELSHHLMIVYEYVEKQLFMANLKNSEVYLDNASAQLMKIKASWDKIA